MLTASISLLAFAMLAAFGFGAGMLGGLIGVGGGIIIVPALFYLAPVLGLGTLDMHTVTGVSIVQVAAAGLAGALGHLRHESVNSRLIISLGGGTTVGALAGGALSGSVPSDVLQGLFATLALAVSIVILLRRSRLSDETSTSSPKVPIVRAAAAGLMTGLLVGMVGVGGGFLLVPLMVFVLHVPMRNALATSLVIVFLSGFAGTIGKAATGQVVWPIALALVVGALPGARLGAFISRRTATHVLATILGVVIAAIAVKMWFDLL